MKALVTLALVLATALGTARPASTASPVSHILFFLVDDYGFADASYKDAMYNGTAAPPTPTIDALALAGVRLESYYVNKLCSPTRTSLLSGRYAYTNGMDNTVIVNGDNQDLPLNLLTIGDHFQRAGWKTSAYGKWDAGCTAWGSTPSCRGFDFYNGHYNAAEDHYTHEVEGGFDWHLDTKGEMKGGDAALWTTMQSNPNQYAPEIYSTTVITSAVEAWTTKQVAANPEAKTFAYVAYQAVHGPLEVPARYINAECEALIPASYPRRRIYCGMVRAVDESIKNITAAYEAMGILNSTLIVLSTDNGGTTSDGGNNYPLRGNKATSFEGGVRGLGFVSGAGLTGAVRGTVNHGIMHVTDWLPTLVTGVAGIPITEPLGRPCPTCTRAVPPLDGVDQWAMLSRGEASARTEVLLDLQTATWKQCTHKNTWPCTYPGSGAIRVGKWKLLHGHQVFTHGSPTTNFCVDRTNISDPKTYPLNATNKSESNKWCDFGWTPPPKADASGSDVSEHVRYPDDGSTNCTGIPCIIGIDSPYIQGDTLLFDVVADMYEEHNVAAEYPEVVKKLLAKLMVYNTSHCGGAPCEPVPKDNGPESKPSKSPQPAFGSELVWLPTRGNHSPAACDTNIYPTA